MQIFKKINYFDHMINDDRDLIFGYYLFDPSSKNQYTV